jgi:hypothetical protein
MREDPDLHDSIRRPVAVWKELAQGFQWHYIFSRIENGFNSFMQNVFLYISPTEGASRLAI